MKKSTLLVLLFILANAVFLSLGIWCLLNLLSLSMAISIDSVLEYPRFIPFCIVLGVGALLGLVAVLVLNMKASERLGFTRSVWLFEYIAAFVLSIPLMKVFETVFEFLQATV